MYWLLKTEPETFSYDQLVKDKRTNWNGVRNYQARNNLREMKTGDIALIYHSGEGKEVVGVAKVVKEAYPDVDPKNPGDWVQVDLVPVKKFETPITLAQIKTTKSLSDMPLIKQSRLSVMPIQKAHFDLISKLGSS